jgi:excisionase family DNA binding protein
LSIPQRLIFMKISDFFYTETGVAKALGISRVTVWRWIKQGRFNVQRFGSVVFIPKDEIELVKKGGKRNVPNPD